MALLKYLIAKDQLPNAMRSQPCSVDSMLQASQLAYIVDSVRLQTDNKD